MKKSIIKKLSAVLAVIMIAVSFAGCADKDKSTSADAGVGAEVKLNGDKIYPIECDDTLDYWQSAAIEWSHRYENFGDTPLGKALAEKTGVKINYIHSQAGQENEQFQIMLTSDDLPDIVQYNWVSYPGGPEMAFKDDYIYVLNDIVDKWAPALKETLAKNDEWNKGSRTDEGKLFNFPMLAEEGILQYAYGPVLNANMLKKANLDIPKTIEQWEEVLKAFKAMGVESPFIGTTGTLLQAFAPAYNFTTGWYRDGDDIKYGQIQPGMKELLITMNRWYSEGLISPDIATVNGNMINADLLNGDAGATLLWCGGGIGSLLNAEADRSKFDLVGTQFPALKDGEKSEYGYMGSVTAATHGASISKNCKNVELAARFMDYGYTEEGHILYNFGIEGESYNWVDKDGEKYPQYTDLILNNPEGLSVSNAMGLYSRSPYYGLMVQDTRYMEQYYITNQQKDAQHKWMNSNMKEHIIPSLYISPENADIDSNNMAAIQTYVDEMMIKFITGKESIDDFDKYVDQVYEFGLEESIKFRKDAYERYKKR